MTCNVLPPWLILRNAKGVDGVICLKVGRVDKQPAFAAEEFVFRHLISSAWSQFYLLSGRGWHKIINASVLVVHDILRIIKCISVLEERRHGGNTTIQYPTVNFQMMNFSVSICMLLSSS